MIQQTIAQIESRIRQSASLGEPAQAELIALLANLKSEVSSLDPGQLDAAHSITGFTHLSTHEATRQLKNPTLLKHSLDGLAASVTGFEESHPRLVAVVNRFCTALANLGI